MTYLLYDEMLTSSLEFLTFFNWLKRLIRSKFKVVNVDYILTNTISILCPETAPILYELEKKIES